MMSQGEKKRNTTVRTVLVFVLAFLLVWGGVPTHALAEMTEEAGGDPIESAEEESVGAQAQVQGGGEANAAPTESGGMATVELEQPVRDPQAEANNDELYEGYVQRMLDESLPNGSESQDEGLPLAAQSAGDGLTGSNLVIYNALKDAAKEIAAGRQTSTVVSVPCSSLSGSMGPWTADDLGVESLDGNEMLDAALSKMGVDRMLIYCSLVADCPYDLYWFDKAVVGMGMSASYYRAGTDENPTVNFEGCSIYVSLYVMPEYSATGQSATTEVRPNLVSSVKTAIARAQGIVSDPAKADMTKLERLAAYKNAICGLVSYDSAAAATQHPSTSNPWQLIHVFDGDESTNVVCEGYSKAFKYLCDLTWANTNDLECLIVTGWLFDDGATGAGAHMWNLVRMDDDRSYLVDVTNCDAGSIGAPDQLLMAYGPSGSYNDYYTFSLDHANSVTYAYSDYDKSYYTPEVLTISSEPYTPVQQLTQVDPPTAATDLVYDGTERQGVAAGTGYTLSGTAAATNAGSYTATATLAEGYEWSDGTTDPVDIPWSIARKSVTVTADNKTIVVGDPEPALTATVEGTVAGDTVTYELARAAGDEMGVYAITPTGDAEQGNYAVTFVPGTLTIKPSESAVVFDTWGTCVWEISDEGVLTVHSGTGASQEENTTSPWSSYNDSITSAVFAAEGENKIILPADSSYLLAGLSNVTSMDLSGADVSSVTNMREMFRGCSALVSPNGISGWNTTSVTDMGNMFSECSSLASLDLSGWKTGAVTDMCGMFDGCSSLASVGDLSGWNTSKVEDMDSMFSGCSSLTTLNLSNWVTTSVTDMGCMFQDCSNISSLVGISGWNTSSVTDMGGMFDGCSKLASLDLSGWDTSSVTDMTDMFKDCSLQTIEVGASYAIKGPAMFPDATADNGKWWSVADQAWYTKDQIVSRRSGTADTYTNYELVQKEDITSATVAFDPAEFVYTGAEQRPVPTVTLGEAQLTAGRDFTCSYASNRNVGTATVTVTGTGAYEGTATGTFQIAKAPLTVRAQNHAIIYGDEPSNDGVVYEGLLGTDTADSLGGTLQYTYGYEQYDGVGNTYTITPSGLTADNYQITFAPGTLTVSPKPVELVWDATSFTYDMSPHVPTATAAGMVNGDTATVTVGGAQTNAGTYNATATSVSNTNYCLPDQVTCEFTIEKASISPTVSIDGWTYGDAAKTPMVSGNPGGGEVSYTYARQGSSVVEYTSEVPANAGSYRIQAVVEETANYQGGLAFSGFEIAKAVPQVTSAPAPKTLTYDGSPKTLVTVGVASGGTVWYSANNSTWSKDVPQATDAGSHSVWYKVVGDLNHSDLAVEEPISVTIGKAGNTLAVAQSATVVVNGTVDLSKLVSGGVGAVTYSIATALEGCSVDENAGVFSAGPTDGTCEVSVSAAGDVNHDSATKVVRVTVMKSIDDALVSFQNASDASVTYDGKAKTPAVKVSVDGTELGSDCYSVEYKNNVNAGTATVTATGKNGYSGTASTTFQIAPADLSGATIASIKGRGYDGKPYEPKPKVTLGGRTLVEKTDYALSYRNNVYASNGNPATVTVTGKGNYAGKKEASFEVWKNGQPMDAWAVARQAPLASVRARDVTVEAPIHVAHAVSAAKPMEFRKVGGDSKLNVDKATGRVTVRRGTPAGTYKVSIRAIAFGGANYADGSRTVECQVRVVSGKLDQDFQVSAVDVTRTAASLASTDYQTRPFSVAMAAGGVTYKRASGSTYLEVDSAGRLKVKRGTPRGTHYAKVWATAAGDAGYRPCTRTVTVKVVVK